MLPLGTRRVCPFLERVEGRLHPVLRNGSIRPTKGFLRYQNGIGAGAGLRAYLLQRTAQERQPVLGLGDPDRGCGF